MPTYGNAHIALFTRETQHNLYVDALESQDSGNATSLPATPDFGR